MQNVDPVFVTWTTLSDTHYFQDGLLNFNNMAIVDWNGLQKPAYNAALELSL